MKMISKENWSLAGIDFDSIIIVEDDNLVEVLKDGYWSGAFMLAEFISAIGRSAFRMDEIPKHKKSCS